MQYPQQPYGWPQPSAPSEGIAVTTHFFPLSFLLAFFKPKIVVDGYELPGTWGRNVVPAPPGQHHVHVHTPYYLPQRMGPADAVVNVHPGRLTELEYKAPLWSFSPGSLGQGPQQYNGVGITVAVAVIPAAVVILVLLIIIVLAVL
jgi:hypothetical protein